MQRRDNMKELHWITDNLHLILLPFWRKCPHTELWLALILLHLDLFTFNNHLLQDYFSLLLFPFSNLKFSHTVHTEQCHKAVTYLLFSHNMKRSLGIRHGRNNGITSVLQTTSHSSSSILSSVETHTHTHGKVNNYILI